MTKPIDISFTGDELAQFCEIDGHELITYYSSYGLVLGPKTVNMSTICKNCNKIEIKVFLPMTITKSWWFL